MRWPRTCRVQRGQAPAGQQSHHPFPDQVIVGALVGQHMSWGTGALGEQAQQKVVGGTAAGVGREWDRQAFLIAETSNSRVTLSLTRTPPVSSAAFQVMP